METHGDLRTPGRRRTVRSTLARADLVRRLRALALAEEDLARVVRFVEDEVAQALEDQARGRFTAAEVREAGGDDALVEALAQARARSEQVAAIRAAGLHRLDSAALEAVVAEARDGGE